MYKNNKTSTPNIMYLKAFINFSDLMRKFAGEITKNRRKFLYIIYKKALCQQLFLESNLLATILRRL